jgi:hypothetical protein
LISFSIDRTSEAVPVERFEKQFSFRVAQCLVRGCQKHGILPESAFRPDHCAQLIAPFDAAKDKPDNLW